MKFVRQQEPQTLAFAPGQTSSMKIGSLSFWLVGLELSVELAKSDSTSPTTYQDYFYRSITALSLLGGGRPYLSLGNPDLRGLYWATRLRLHGRCRTPDMQAGSVTLSHQMPITFGVNPIMVNDAINRFDPTAAVQPDNDLTLQVTWAANSALGANRTINSGILRVTYLGIVPEKPGEEPKFYPVWRSDRFSPSQQYGGLSGTAKLAPGFYYRRSTLVFLNGASPADNRTDGRGGAAVSEVGLKTADGRTPLNMKVYDFTAQSQSQFIVADDNSAVPGAALAPGASVASIGYNAGVGQIDYAQMADTSNPAKADPLYGLNLIGKGDNAAALVFTVDSPTNTSVVMVHEAYLPY
jgi:hypothetical protein